MWKHQQEEVRNINSQTEPCRVTPGPQARPQPKVDAFGKEMIKDQPNYMYMFKGEVPVPLLGQVDDLMGVSNVGYKAEQINGYVNAKNCR